MGEHMGEPAHRHRLPPYPNKENALWPVGGRPWARDIVLLVFAMGGLFYEVMWGGARPAALSALTAILLSPLLLRVDQHRRDDMPAGEDP